MEAFPHGNYVVIEGSVDELRGLAARLEEEGSEVEETAAKIHRGLERGATRIAVSRERAGLAATALAGAESFAETRRAIERVLERDEG